MFGSQPVKVGSEVSVLCAHSLELRGHLLLPCKLLGGSRYSCRLLDSLSFESVLQLRKPLSLLLLICRSDPGEIGDGGLIVLIALDEGWVRFRRTSGLSGHKRTRSASNEQEKYVAADSHSSRPRPRHRRPSRPLERWERGLDRDSHVAFPMVQRQR